MGSEVRGSSQKSIKRGEIDIYSLQNASFIVRLISDFWGTGSERETVRERGEACRRIQEERRNHD
jgi:hypothetical protein